MPYDFSEMKVERELTILEQLSQWLIRTGITINGTRYFELIELLRVIVDHYKKSEISQLLNKYDEATLWVALTDATAFVRIYLGFKDIKSHCLPRAKLKEMLDGPLLPWNESPDVSNIHARNTLFELEMAAWFKRAGLEVTNYDDAQFDFMDHTFNIQCKRIHSPKRIGENVASAVSQITKRMDSQARTRGLICLCIDKISEKEGWILEVDDHRSIPHFLDRIAKDFIMSHNHLWQRVLNIHVLGTLVVFNALALIKGAPDPMLTHCRQTTLDIIPDNTPYQQYDYRLVKELSARLNTV